MIIKYKSKAFVWGIPGVVLQMLGALGVFAETKATPDIEPKFAAIFFIIMGTAFLMAGLACYCRAKGRHYAWALTGLASFFGFFILGLLRDKAAGKNKKR